MTELHTLYQSFNYQFFDGILPPCDIVWSRRLTRTGGLIQVQTRKITLSIPLIQEAFQNGGHRVCGVWCENSERALEEILKHEMIHLWLFEKGLPHGHTPLFRAKARAIGQPKTRHQIENPRPRASRKTLRYACLNCSAIVWRAKKFRGKVACASCCRAWSGGKFDARFALKLQKADL